MVLVQKSELGSGIATILHLMLGISLSVLKSSMLSSTELTVAARVLATLMNASIEKHRFLSSIRVYVNLNLCL